MDLKKIVMWGGDCKSLSMFQRSLRALGTCAVGFGILYLLSKFLVG